MNYYKSRQRKDGKWDYTCRNDNDIRTVGYCYAYTPWTDELLGKCGLTREMVQKEEDLAKKYIDKYHTCGHNTSEEADNCYREYMLDQKLVFRRMNSDTQEKCKVCKEWTQDYAFIGEWTMFCLCEKHNNRQEVEKLYSAPSEIWCS